jgi:hypothetical protein
MPITFESFWQHRYARRYAAALAAETARREEAFLGRTVEVCGFKLRRMTPEDLLILTGVGNPFVVPGQVTPGDIAQFLWILRVPPVPRPWYRRLFRLQAPGSSHPDASFYAHVVALPFAAATAEIYAHVDAIFADVPAVEEAVAPRRLCFLAPLVTEMVDAGWRESEILAMPLGKLFQYRAAIRNRKDSDSLALGPSDLIKAECMAAWNALPADQKPPVEIPVIPDPPAPPPPPAPPEAPADPESKIEIPNSEIQ